MDFVDQLAEVRCWARANQDILIQLVKGKLLTRYAQRFGLIRGFFERLPLLGDWLFRRRLRKMIGGY